MASAIQLYTLRDMDCSVPELLDRVAEAGFDGVEYAYRVPEADSEAVRTALDETGLAVPAAHVPVDVLEDDLAATVEQYRSLRTERLVVPYLDSESFGTVERVRETARRLDGLADRLADHDYPLLYHNHDAEFADLDGRTAFDVLVEATDSVAFELDVGLATYAGVDAADVIDSHADRIDLLHCTDTHVDAAEPAHAAFGTGDVDYDAVFDAAERAGIEWRIYENGSQDDPVGELDHAAERFLS
ncbi:TIM barrel protein [Halomicrobium mukohataei]|uniref:TIM barrel protein n=1 Tax=Halomicrobium mukohataei TaxID=57705 RepID=A0A847U6T0_9EURY|nr:sugar phosphate isomerase/epimerase [Halomicrobium mukohataei]NLV08699.1 TIM barrel protein [Halomicrobium mukohataei]